LVKNFENGLIPNFTETWGLKTYLTLTNITQQWYQNRWFGVTNLITILKRGHHTHEGRGNIYIIWKKNEKKNSPWEEIFGNSSSVSQSPTLDKKTKLNIYKIKDL